MPRLTPLRAGHQCHTYRLLSKNFILSLYAEYQPRTSVQGPQTENDRLLSRGTNFSAMISTDCEVYFREPLVTESLVAEWTCSDCRHADFGGLDEAAQ